MLSFFSKHSKFLASFLHQAQRYKIMYKHEFANWLRRDIACWIVVYCVCGLYFSKEEPRVRVGRLHGHSRPRPWSSWSLLRRHHFDPAVVFSIYCRPLARAQPSTTLVLLVASSPSLRSCRRFPDLWLNRARGIPTEALLKFRGEALLRCFHFCSRVQ